MTAAAERLAIALVDPTSDEGRAVVRRFFVDIIDRYPGRSATDAEVEAVMAAEPSDDLRGDTGFLLVARVGDTLVGCAGVRVVPVGAAGTSTDGGGARSRVGEVTRVFVDGAHRGLGAGGALLRRVEELSAARGLRTLRLTVRDDLDEARRLYERLGYRPTAAFSDDPYADHFLAKEIAGVHVARVP